LTGLRVCWPVHSFDVFPDGKSILFDRVQENAKIILIDLKHRTSGGARMADVLC
jgi:hypothetical protein